MRRKNESQGGGHGSIHEDRASPWRARALLRRVGRTFGLVEMRSERRPRAPPNAAHRPQQKQSSPAGRSPADGDQAATGSLRARFATRTTARSRRILIARVGR